MPTFRIQHITRYKYDRPVKENISEVRIFPVEDQHQSLVSMNLQVTGNPHIETYFDYFGNRVGEFSVLKPHQELTIDNRFTVHIPEGWDPPGKSDITPEALAGNIENDLKLIGLSEPERIESQDIIKQLLYETDILHKPVVEIAEACCGYIYRTFTYKKGITNVETTIDEILEHRSGVCQDFAHVLLQMLRTAGIPARYVSGYICPNKSGMRGEGATHAWVEYYLPGNGWIGLDPTNNVFAGPYHIRLATGRDFADCTPVKGAFKGIARQTLSVFVSVGYEDGHVFEDMSDVQQQSAEVVGTEPWQDDLIARQQQQQQQQ